jgi:hypothetical protein
MHDRVAHRRQPAHDRALPDRDQHIAVAPEIPEHMDVFLVAAAALDDADVAALGEMLDVGQRRAVDLDQLHQFHQPFVDVEDRHVAAETPGKRSGCDPGLSQLSHGASPSIW